jgi:hypothetical protein
MTRKDYVALANIINQQTLVGPGVAPETVLDKIGLINWLVVYLKSDNARFNEATFRAACKTTP